MVSGVESGRKDRVLVADCIGTEQSQIQIARVQEGSVTYIGLAEVRAGQRGAGEFGLRTGLAEVSIGQRGVRKVGPPKLLCNKIPS